MRHHVGGQSVSGACVRNRIDFTQPPEALFLDPIRDSGLQFLRRPDFIWRDRTPALIEGFALSAYPVMRRRIDRFLRFTRRHKTFRRAIEFNTLPVLLEQASFRQSFATAKGKCLLSGASGFRLMNRYCWENETATQDAPAQLVAYFQDRQAQSQGLAFPVLAEPPPPGTDFALQCRNTFNYFHFLTETLPHLCLLDGIGFTGRIFINHPNAPEKTRAFAFDLIGALFPEWADRVIFRQAPQDYGSVLSGYNLINSYYHLPPELIGSVDGLAPSDLLWKGTTATRAAQSVLAMNSLDTCLLHLRERALRAIAGRPRHHLPRRFYVARRPDQSRRRPLKGEAALLDLLSAFGFSKIHFEDFEPLDQIALMAGAEVMVSVHGAGFANMLFAAPGALVIELGTLQTAQHRWGDFWPLAHASGCRYLSFFADHDTPDPLRDPDFAQEGIVPVALGDHALGQLGAFLAASLGHVPRLENPTAAADLVRQLIRSDQAQHAEAILSSHADLMGQGAPLHLAQADLHRAAGSYHAELLSLHDAWLADASDWRILARMIWAARKLERLDVLAWAKAQLAERFPDRCSALARDRPWLRDLG